VATAPDANGRTRGVTPLPDLLHGRSRSGPVRDRRPVYVDLLPPCNAGCPAGENIQPWLALAKAGGHEDAWRQLVADHPLPAIHGRVCWQFDPPAGRSGRRVLVIGAGPSGLSAAFGLAEQAVVLRRDTYEEMATRGAQHFVAVNGHREG
jgi:hypothetical protein